MQNNIALILFINITACRRIQTTSWHVEILTLVPAKRQTWQSFTLLYRMCCEMWLLHIVSATVCLFMLKLWKQHLKRSRSCSGTTTLPNPINACGTEHKQAKHHTNPNRKGGLAALISKMYNSRRCFCANVAHSLFHTGAIRWFSGFSQPSPPSKT